jgi:thioesterase domain-containing protein
MGRMAMNERTRTRDADGLRVLRAAADPGLPPVVLIHPGALAPTVYIGLVDALPVGHAVLVADLEGVPEYTEAALRPEHVPELAIESLGERVLRWLPDGMPSGSVFVGWSFGGTVALDVVRRLDNVSALIVLDALAPVPEYTVDGERLDADDRVTEWFAMYLAARRGAAAPATSEVTGVTERLGALLDAGVRTGLLLPGTTPEGLRKAYRAYAGGLVRNNRLSRQYPSNGMSPVDTPVTLVRPACGMVRTPGALGWDQVASTVTVHSCPGDHYSMLGEPAGVRLVAGLCAAALEPKGKVRE